MSIEKITSKILDDAKDQAEASLNEARLRAESIVNDAREKAKELEMSLTSSGEVERDKLMGRRKSVAEIDGRKIVLAEKRKLIDKAFEEAADIIASMDKEEYTGLLFEKIIQGEAKGCELVLNQKDRDSIGEILVSKVNKELGEGSLKLSEEVRNIKGGFLLKRGRIYINSSIENMISDVKEELITEVAEKLFR
ncbi:MAG: V-type ATP synthase subunit E [Peptostreptococcaceae bacterium]|nr:V-type ATP synthase subunit E [Peptostreptococcaceae bacterium]MDY5739483.1 V-type ATP synthase subunit E [Anaerovoracaceae bacterium]